MENAKRKDRLSVRVASYNVHRCVGIDGRTDPHRVASVLKEVEADLVALQEVDTSMESERELGPLEDILAETGMHPIMGPTIARRSGFYGNVLLTRHEVLHVAHHDLSIIAYEPRGAIEARLRIGESIVRVIATHLGLRRAERRNQIARLLNVMAEDDDADLDILLGDFNIWFPWSRNGRLLERYFGATPKAASYPTLLPLFALDRIWVLPDSAMKHFEVHRSSASRFASDHLPVWADIEIPHPTSGTAART